MFGRIHGKCEEGQAEIELFTDVAGTQGILLTVMNSEDEAQIQVFFPVMED
jgi:hypothetical protein